VKHIVCFSGGKDSTALILWAKDNLPEFTTVFCDTGWEHPLTYAYIEEINQTVLGGKLVTLKSEKYPDMMSCFLDHHMFPNGFARFCTEDMKIVPMHRFIESQNDETTTYQGIRADESDKRRSATEEQWCDDAGGYLIRRPLLHWTANQVFGFMKDRGIAPNHLYLMGLSRVGCWPCIHANLRDMKAYLRATPEITERLMEAERLMREKTGFPDRTFFRHGFIPERFCSVLIERDGKQFRIPTCEDVFRYIESVDENQLPLLPARSCMSVYNLCE
jgi:3'-phosphoadenosine 5'-phosphosulfate sulfotransferase (PAPS reductase)/FAD synthetase